MEGTFEVRSGRKVREYRVALLKEAVELRPADFTQGKNLELDLFRVINCKKVGEGGGSFSVAYCAGDSLETKLYEFGRSKKEEDKKKKKGIEETDEGDVIEKWVEAVRKAAGLEKTGGAERKKTLLLVNPKAGKGEGVSVYRKLKKLLSLADVPFESLVTERALHGREFVCNNAERISEEFDAVVSVSGDGGVHEALNGFMDAGSQDEGWRQLMEGVSVGVVPVGSGNALARSLHHMLGEGEGRRGMWSSVSNVVRARRRRADLFLAETKTNKRLGFLSVGFGLIADVDIESEHLRYLGELRFTLWALHRIKNLRRYRARLSYLRARDIGDGIRYADEDEESGGVGGERTEQEEAPAAAGGGGDYPAGLRDPLPSSWTTEEDDFVCVYAVTLPYLDANTFFAPECKADDGVIWICVIRKEATKGDLLKLMTAVEKGEHLKVPNVDMVRARAFRLEPVTSKAATSDDNDDSSTPTPEQGILTVDGERVEFGPVQARVMPGAVSYLVKK